MNIHNLPIFPPNLSVYKDMPPQLADDEYNALFFHEKNTEGFHVWNVYYDIKRKINLSIRIGRPILAFIYIYKNNILYETNDAKEFLLMEQQCNLFYLSNSFTLNYKFNEEGVYSAVIIEIPIDFLKKWILPDPLLKGFLENVNNNIPCVMREKNMHVPHEMKEILEHIINSPYIGKLKKLFLEAKIRELLAFYFSRISLKSNEAPTKIKLSQQDIFKIQKVRDYLLMHINTPLSLKELALKVGTNEFKLKYGFKHLYNITVFNFLFEERMKKAKELLKNTNIPVSDIATFTGYKNISGFTAAFKKRFSQAPTDYRSELNNRK